MSDITYEDVDVERGDKIRFNEDEVNTVSGKGQIDGQVCFEEGFSLAPYIVAEALQTGGMEIIEGGG